MATQRRNFGKMGAPGGISEQSRHVRFPSGAQADLHEFSSSLEIGRIVQIPNTIEILTKDDHCSLLEHWSQERGRPKKGA